jgi:glycosyltransferase involved in cell wall biosynthesis
MSDTQPPAPRPVFAIVANTQAPYRLHVHTRIAREIPEVRLFSLFTLYSHPDAPWAPQSPPEINPVLFAGAPPPPGRLRNQRLEWHKAGEIIRWLKDNDARAVLVNGYGDVGRLRIIRWCTRHGIPTLMWGDSNIRDERLRVARSLKRRLKTFALRRLLPRLSAILACGTLGRQYFEHYGADPARIFYFPVEPDYDLIRHLPPAAFDRARATFGLAEGRRRIVYSGRLAPVKRVDLLVDAFAAIAERRPDWDLLLIGNGPLRAELEARVPAALRSRVRWTGFVEDQEAISAAYRSSDVLVLPSDLEPWALVINEAAAAGLAIVASDVVAAAAELVRDGVNGRIFPAGDLAALTGCLLDVTDGAKTDAMKAGSSGMLEDWRRRGDPIAGLRAALRFCGVLPAE